MPILPELNYMPANKKRFACLPYQIVEQVLSEGGPGKGAAEQALGEEGPVQSLVERCFACGVLHHALGCLRHLGSHSSRGKDKVHVALHTPDLLHACLGRQWDVDNFSPLPFPCRIPQPRPRTSSSPGGCKFVHT